ncbi:MULTISPECIES: metal-dependent transcriptional regulator [Rhodococcus]|uniref:metal-dependent transcriptional regulator n=1 Tax=Rhodococcus TaxID=1827 RepID=UPI001CE35122|nr:MULTISPECIES: iron dependent repressor, metal binding and dimerization domain protein [Rhodococcus]MDJ0401677.1 iron dependent repressor, metal binding and dimerization domain protein [Rhodococcus rhodochrous]
MAGSPPRGGGGLPCEPLPPERSPRRNLDHGAGSPSGLEAVSSVNHAPTPGAADLILRPTAHRAELTGHGRQHARNVVRRNCLVKTFRAPELSLPRIELPGEADRLEHVVGILFEVRLVRVLGYPRSNPFGSPIPLPTEDRAES